MKFLLALLLILIVLIGAAAAEPSDFGARLSGAAIEQTKAKVVYDSSYRMLAYPGGDVPADRGVCSDVVIRAFRAVGIDLQKHVHEDMTAHFSAYPALWGLVRPDSNIDHRRVPNIETYLTRAGASLPLSLRADDFEAGDIVAWNLRGGAGFLPHVGVVTDRIGVSGWPLVVHNIGAGPEIEDVLFLWPMTGHYRVATSPTTPAS